MGLVGLTYGQVAIGATIYGPCRLVAEPLAGKKMLYHAVSNSVYQPMKDLGHEVPVLTFMLLVTAANLDAFMVDVLNDTERKISWMIGVTEAYFYARAGRIVGNEVIQKWGTGLRSHWVVAEFRGSRTAVYNGASDAVRWGG